MTRIISGLADPEDLDLCRDSDDVVMESIEEEIETEDEPSHMKDQISVYRNPLWSELGEPESTRKAAKLDGDEVPVDCPNDFQVGYVPAQSLDNRENRERSKKVPLQLLDKDCNIKKVQAKTSNSDVIPDLHMAECYSQKVIAGAILLDKSGPHDHRNSETQKSPVSSGGGYSSSSKSCFQKEDLFQSYRRVFCQDKEATSLGMEFCKDVSDSTSSFSSAPLNKLDAFVEQVEEDALGRLDFAKMQLMESYVESKMPHKMKGEFSKEGAFRVNSVIEQDCSSDASEIRLPTEATSKSLKDSLEFGNWGSSAHWRVQQCISPTKFQQESLTKTQRVVESKDFQLLEKKVQKELGVKSNIIKRANTPQHSKAINPPLQST